MEYLSIGKMAEKLGITEQTLRNWDKSGKLKPAYVSESGYRYYSNEQFAKVTGLFYKDKTKRVIIGYCRVSSRREDLDRQIKCIRQYCLAKGYQFRIISDIGSGIDYSRKGLHELLKMVMNNEVSKIVVIDGSRLVSYGSEFIDLILSSQGVEVEVIDETEVFDEQERVFDLIYVCVAFSEGLSDRKASHIKSIITRLREGDVLA